MSIKLIDSEIQSRCGVLPAQIEIGASWLFWRCGEFLNWILHSCMNRSCCPNYVLIVSSDSILADTNNTCWFLPSLPKIWPFTTRFKLMMCFFLVCRYSLKLLKYIPDFSLSHTNKHTLYRRPNIRVTQKTRQEKNKFASTVHSTWNATISFAPNRYTREAVCGPQNHETRDTTIAEVPHTLVDSRLGKWNCCWPSRSTELVLACLDSTVVTKEPEQHSWRPRSRLTLTGTTGKTGLGSQHEQLTGCCGAPRAAVDGILMDRARIAFHVGYGVLTMRRWLGQSRQKAHAGVVWGLKRDGPTGEGEKRYKGNERWNLRRGWILGWFCVTNI